MQVSVHDAKAQLPHLLDLIQEGEEVIIHQDGRPIARLIPLNQSLESPFGAMEGEFELPEDWDRPLTDTETDAFWEGAW